MLAVQNEGILYLSRSELFPTPNFEMMRGPLLRVGRNLTSLFVEDLTMIRSSQLFQHGHETYLALEKRAMYIAVGYTDDEHIN